MLRWIARALAVFGFLVLASTLIAILTFETVPTRNCKRTHFDTIIVLGSPALLSGQPSLEERSRVLEGIKEFKDGRADHMLFTGGAAQNQFVEAQVMARLAESEGVPAGAILVEGQAQNTIQNIYFSYQIMEQKGWTSAEVVSSPSHLPRAALILEHYHFQWQEHVAPWPPEFGWRDLGLIYSGEIVETLVLRWHGFSPSPFLPPR